jgi:hypothetical protein
MVATGIGCASEESPPSSRPPPAAGANSDDVIVTMGHGKLIGEGFKLLEPNQELFERTQRAMLAQLTAAAQKRNVDVDALAEAARRPDGDRFLANAALIERLIEVTQLGNHATAKGINGAMRDAYVRSLPPERRDLEPVARITFASGQKYIDECQKAGVPIPPPMYRTGPGNWTRRDILTTNFIGGIAELWEYSDSSGRCLALPRYSPGSSVAGAFGVICLGTDPSVPSRACFWDNPRGVGFTANVEVPLTSLVGGYDLEANNQGVCSDCHAGANPFVVHPNDKAFTGLPYNDLPPGNWYEPIVHSNWPQNRGPSNMLAAVASPGRCDSGGCHAAPPAGRAGQFPILSTELPGYCSTVLSNTAGIPSPAIPFPTAQTMPPGLANLPDYAAHRQALRDACASTPDTGKITKEFPQPSETKFVSPPSLQAVAYDCAEAVEVSNVILDATVTLSVNGTSYVQVADNVRLEFMLSSPLKVGDVITASQSINGLTSATTSLTVRDHNLDYPNGIPAPAVYPDLVYECADVIAVTHVPGARVTVDSSVTSPVSYVGATGWTGFWLGTQFRVGDKFIAQATLCPNEPSSPWSPTVYAVTAPTTLPPPVFNPQRAYEGQRLISIANLTNGARTRFDVSATFAGLLDSPISWWNDFNLSSNLGRPLAAGDIVSAQSELCVKAPPVDISVSTCGGLPAPRIEAPILDGATAVVVALAQPGARIRVLDASGAEIGNGSGTVINLSRPLVAGERIFAVQELGACRSRTAHLLTVQAVKPQKG